MTRLYYEIIKDIPVSLKELDRMLVSATGLDLSGLAARAANVPPAAVPGSCPGLSPDAGIRPIGNYSAAVVPVSSGQGVIPGFALAVKAVLEHIRLPALVTGQPDVAGFGEAFGNDVDVILAADDRKFLALNLRHRSVTDNARATAAGFVHALAAAAEKRFSGLQGKKVLVLGLGPVGSHAVTELLRLGARVIVHDTDQTKMEQLAAFSHGLEPVAAVEQAANLWQAIGETDYVLDATPAPDIINEEMIRPETIISAPGVPHGLTSGALAKIGSRFIHDNLPLGVATMVLQSIFDTGH